MCEYSMEITPRSEKSLREQWYVSVLHSLGKLGKIVISITISLVNEQTLLRESGYPDYC